jgi:hypothetical protein
MDDENGRRLAAGVGGTHTGFAGAQGLLTQWWRKAPYFSIKRLHSWYIFPGDAPRHLTDLNSGGCLPSRSLPETSQSSQVAALMATAFIAWWRQSERQSGMILNTEEF